MASGKDINTIRMRIVQGRKVERGYTIDSKETRRRDDGFSVQKNKDNSWTVKVSIADVAAFVPVSCPLDRTAMEQAANGNHNFLPLSFVTKAMSLDRGRLTPAVTYTVTLDQSFAITHYTVARTAFESMGALTYTQYNADAHPDTALWRELAFGIERNRYQHRADSIRKAFVEAGASVEASTKDNFDGRGCVIEQMQYLARRVTGDIFLRAGCAAFYVKHTPRIGISGGTHELRGGVFNVLKSVTASAYGREDYNVDASSPLRRYDDLMMQRNLVALIEGKELPYDAQALEELRVMSRYSARGSDRTLCLAFKENDASGDTPRVVAKGAEPKPKPKPKQAHGSMRRLQEIFARHTDVNPEVISAQIWHGATKLSFDIAAIVQPRTSTIWGLALAETPDMAENMAVRDAVDASYKAFNRAPV